MSRSQGGHKEALANHGLLAAEEHDRSGRRGCHPAHRQGEAVHGQTDDPEEAALQLELVGHDFFVFTNAESAETAVVYRRRDGDYGLISLSADEAPSLRALSRASSGDRMMKLVDKVLHFGEGRRMKAIEALVGQVSAREADMVKMSDDTLRAQTAAFKARIDNGATLDELLPEAFAAAREAARRSVGMRPFDVQVVGACVLHQGGIAEMKTGEGKTLVATLPVYLNALAGNGVHLVTVNDYLAGRDAEWMGPVYRFLGLEVAALQNNMESGARRAAYLADVTYGTNTEFGFDYLRDNMALAANQVVQRGHFYCIVDEVDSILVDEARTPLIISGPGEHAAKTYYDFARVVRQLKPRFVIGREADIGDGVASAGFDYEVDEKKKTVATTRRGSGSGREAARHREPVRGLLGAAGQPSHAGAACRDPVQA